MSHPTVTTARAAEIVGLGYEGLRAYIKRGLGGRVGLLPGFHAPGSATHDDPAPRAKWTRFGVPDLCLFRTAKLLMDSGFSFESANAVVSRHDRWSDFAHDEEPVSRVMAVWPPYGDHIIYEPDQRALLEEALRLAPEIVTLINLGSVHRHVLRALEETDKFLPRKIKERIDNQLEKWREEGIHAVEIRLSADDASMFCSLLGTPRCPKVYEGARVVVDTVRASVLRGNRPGRPDRISIPI